MASAFGSCASLGGSELHDASPAASVQGQSWPGDASMDIDTALSAGEHTLLGGVPA